MLREAHWLRRKKANDGGFAWWLGLREYNGIHTFIVNHHAIV
jgi:hypothetical protein